MKKGDSENDNKSILPNGKKAQAEIIVSVLLILLVVGSIVVIWAIVSNTVQSSTNKASSEPLNIKLEVADVKFWYNGSSEVDLSRGADNGQLTQLKFIFYNKNGNNKIISRTGNLLQKTSKAFFFNQSEIGFSFNEIDKVSVAPVFGENTGIEVFQSDGNIKKNNQKDSNGNKLVYYSQDLRLSPSANITSWWKFDSDAKDSTDGNYGMLMNGATINISGKNLILDGVDDYVDAGNQESLKPQQVSISAWIKTGDTKLIQFIAGFGDTGVEGYWIGVGSGSPAFSIGTHANYYQLYTTNLVNDNLWHNIIGTYDRSIMMLYKDGTLIGSSTNANGDISYFGLSSFKVGQIEYLSPTRYFNGAIDEVMIFKSALDKNQISTIYNNQKKNYGY